MGTMHGADGATDVVIIGGGANGCGVARDLALRGLRVTLVEKGDFARGASGASSGMIHGGPRYLLDDVETTKHSCTDSGYIQKMAPHLCFRIPFLVPIPRDNPFGPLGMLLHDTFFGVYDRYTPLKNGVPHARMDAGQMRAIEPGLSGDFLGGVTLDEWGIDVGRLCLSSALDARAHGAELCTYTEVERITQNEAGEVVGVHLRELASGRRRTLAARAVVNCAGPWADEMVALTQAGRAQSQLRRRHLRPGKGVHLIYAGRLSNFAIITNAKDGRQIFVMPYLNETWIGTTDDDYYGSLDDLWATEDEVAYLREAGEAVLPGLRDQRLIGTRVGVRNTIHGWGVTEDALSRRYEVVDHATEGAPGFFSLLGGKLASFRVQAQDVADKVAAQLGNHAPCQTHARPLPGGEAAANPVALATRYGVALPVAARLVARHGAGADKVLDYAKGRPGGLQVLDAAEPTLAGEVAWALEHECVGHLGDLMARCRLAMGPDMGLQGARPAAAIMAEQRDLDVEGERAELMDLLRRRWRSARPVLEGIQLAQMEAWLSAFGPLWQQSRWGAGEAERALEGARG